LNKAVDPPAHAFVARSVDGHQGRKTVGLAPADTFGTRLTLAACAPRVYSSGWKRNALPATSFLHTLIGMRKTESTRNRILPKNAAAERILAPPPELSSRCNCLSVAQSGDRVDAWCVGGYGQIDRICVVVGTDEGVVAGYVSRLVQE
jgi:hypothetical protein